MSVFLAYAGNADMGGLKIREGGKILTKKHFKQAVKIRELTV